MEEKIECDIKDKTYYFTEDEFEVVKQILGDPIDELSDCCGAEVDEHGADDHTSRCLGCGEFCEVVYIWEF